jgi:hypothetical protein
MRRGHWIVLAAVMLASFMILAAQRDGLCFAAAAMFLIACVKAWETP